MLSHLGENSINVAISFAVPMAFDSTSLLPLIRNSMNFEIWRFTGQLQNNISNKGAKQ